MTTLWLQLVCTHDLMEYPVSPFLNWRLPPAVLNSPLIKRKFCWGKSFSKTIENSAVFLPGWLNLGVTLSRKADMVPGCWHDSSGMRSGSQNNSLILIFLLSLVPIQLFHSTIHSGRRGVWSGH